MTVRFFGLGIKNPFERVKAPRKNPHARKPNNQIQPSKETIENSYLMVRTVYSYMPAPIIPFQPQKQSS